MDDLGHSSRRDGWTAARRRAFVDALARGVSVEAACAVLGPSVSSAYRLRRRHAGFAAAWDAARAAGRREVQARARRHPELRHFAQGPQLSQLVPELRERAPRQAPAPRPQPEHRPGGPNIPELRAHAPALSLADYLSRPGAVIGLAARGKRRPGA